MKKFLPYLLVILVLAGTLTWFILHKSRGTFENKEYAFAVRDRESISKVVMTDADHKRIELSNMSGAWMVNGKYPVREELMQSLLEVITRVTTRYPVPKAAHDIVLKNMLEKNIKVEVYVNKDEKPVRTYYVGGPTSDAKGTYMLLEQDEKIQPEAFVTYIPGMLGYLTPRYNMDEENWRSRQLFHYKPDEIKSLSVEYPAEEGKSFTLNRVGKDSFALSPQDEKYRINQAYQQRYIGQYLEFYNSVYIEVFDNGNHAKDSVIKTTPYCIISVTKTDNAVTKVKLFYMPLNRRSKMQEDEKGNEMTYDVDRYYAALNDDKDFAVVQYYVFGKLLRNYRDFYFKPGTK